MAGRPVAPEAARAPATAAGPRAAGTDRIRWPRRQHRGDWRRRRHRGRRRRCERRGERRRRLAEEPERQLAASGAAGRAAEPVARRRRGGASAVVRAAPRGAAAGAAPAEAAGAAALQGPAVPRRPAVPQERARYPRPSNGRRRVRSLSQNPGGFRSRTSAVSSTTISTSSTCRRSTARGPTAAPCMTFTDWPQMATATQTPLPYGGDRADADLFQAEEHLGTSCTNGARGLSPTLTATNPTSATSWNGPYKLYDGASIDETVVCTEHDLLSLLRE